MKPWDIWHSKVLSVFSENPKVLILAKLCQHAVSCLLVSDYREQWMFLNSETWATSRGEGWSTEAVKGNPSPGLERHEPGRHSSCQVTDQPRSSWKLCANALSPSCEARVLWPRSWKGHNICDTGICPLGAPLHLSWQGEWIANLGMRELLRRQSGPFN